MPIWDEARLRAAVAAGEIGAITLDTNTFNAAQCNLKWRVFLSLDQFKGTGIKYMLTDVVSGEVRAHLQKRAEEAASKLKAAAREFDVAWDVTDALPKAAASIAATPDSRAAAQAALDAYVAATGAEILPSAGNVDVAVLLESYFSAAPPFENKADKKHEFPDALALMALETWAEARSNFVVAISKDGGWRRYAAKSPRIVCIDDLRWLLGRFNEEATFVAKRVAAQLNQGHAEQLSAAIDETIQRFVDNIYPDIEASTAFYYDVEYEGAFVGERSEIDLSTVDAVASTDDSITISFDVEFSIEAEASFTFYVRDEGENIPIAGTSASRTLYLTLPMTVEIARNSDPPELLNIEDAGELSVTLDFGHVEPDDSEPEPEDWEEYDA